MKGGGSAAVQGRSHLHRHAIVPICAGQSTDPSLPSSTAARESGASHTAQDRPRDQIVEVLQQLQVIDARGRTCRADRRALIRLSPAARAVRGLAGEEEGAATDAATRILFVEGGHVGAPGPPLLQLRRGERVARDIPAVLAAVPVGDGRVVGALGDAGGHDRPGVGRPEGAEGGGVGILCGDILRGGYGVRRHRGSPSRSAIGRTTAPRWAGCTRYPGR